MLISSSQYGIISLAFMENDGAIKTWPPGSSSYCCEKDFGTIVIRNYDAETYSIRHILLNFIKAIPLVFKEQDSLLRNRLVLKGNFQMKTGVKKKMLVKQGQIVLFNASEDEETIYFEKASQYSFFDTTYSGIFLEPLLSSFPSLSEFINHRSTFSEQQKIKQPRFALPEITRIAQKLLACPYDESLRKIYFEIKIKDYLFQSFITALQKGALPEQVQDKVVVPILKALPLIKSITANGHIVTNNGISFFRSGDHFRIIVSASRSKGGNIYLDQEIPELVEKNNFEKTSDKMVALLPEKNIDKLVEILQTNHSCSVIIHSSQLKDLKSDGVRYSNRMKIELPDAEPETADNFRILELEAEALSLELELLAA